MLNSCGVLQFDYNRFLVTGIRPPSTTRRVTQHFLIPMTIFCTAGYAAVSIQSMELNQIVCTGLVFAIIGWVITGCINNTGKRNGVRVTLMERLRRIKRLRGNVVNDNVFCTHTYCGCVSNDDTTEQNFDNNEETDFCSKLSKNFFKVFCGQMCGYWWQLCGSCALSQEAREIEHLIPEEKRAFDYITLQPFMGFMNDIRQLRQENNGVLMKHFNALSKLSRMLLKGLCTVT